MGEIVNFLFRELVKGLLTNDFAGKKNEIEKIGAG